MVIFHSFFVCLPEGTAWDDDFDASFDQTIEMDWNAGPVAK